MKFTSIALLVASTQAMTYSYDEKNSLWRDLSEDSMIQTAKDMSPLQGKPHQHKKRAKDIANNDDVDPWVYETVHDAVEPVAWGRPSEPTPAWSWETTNRGQIYGRDAYY